MLFVIIVLIATVVCSCLFLFPDKEDNLPRFYGDENGYWIIITYFNRHNYSVEKFIENQDFFEWYEEKELLEGYLWPHHAGFALRYVKDC